MSGSEAGPLTLTASTTDPSNLSLLVLVLAVGIAASVTSIFVTIVTLTFCPRQWKWSWSCCKWKYWNRNRNKNRRIVLMWRKCLSSPSATVAAIFLSSLLVGAGSEFFFPSPKGPGPLKVPGGDGEEPATAIPIPGGEKGASGTIYFITPTQFSLLQIPKLTKIGQALFPHRDKVVWVVVSVTRKEDLLRKDISTKKGMGRLKLTDFGESFTGFSANRRMKLHLSLLKKQLDRFGVPYVLLKSQRSRSMVERFRTRVDKKWRARIFSSKDPSVYGAAIGLLWTLESFGEGVVLLGNEDFAYNSKIFEELKVTDIASMWPIGLGTAVGFSAPIWDKSTKKAAGYYTGNIVNITASSLQNKNFINKESMAFSLEYLKEKSSAVQEVLRMISHSLTIKQFSFKDPESDIKVLGNYGSEILVWRTAMAHQYFPSTLPYPKAIRNSSILKVWRNLFTVYYDQIPLDLNFTEKNYSILV